MDLFYILLIVAVPAVITVSMIDVYGTFSGIKFMLVFWAAYFIYLIIFITAYFIIKHFNLCMYFTMVCQTNLFA